MKKTYLILTILGFLIPNVLVAKVSWETGNVLLYTDLITTLQAMFANDISTIFVLDLLFVVGVFLWLSYREAQKVGMQTHKLWVSWIFTFAFGLAGGLPLFLYFRESEKHTA